MVRVDFSSKPEAMSGELLVHGLDHRLDGLGVSGGTAQPVVEAILASRGRIETGRLREAALQARAEGLLTMAEWRRVRQVLGA